MHDDRPRSFAKALGPGLLFAGAAVGVSHLVQATRAGALFGLSLVVFIVLANIFKYPAFQFGPRYAAATGTSLLQGYRRQGRWALIVYSLLTAGTMLTVQAAVVMTTAGLFIAVFELSLSPLVVSAVLTVIAALLLATGGYKILDRLIKVVVAVLTVATFAATAMVLPDVSWSGPWFVPSEAWDTGTVLLVAGLIGWMPSAIDISIWHSLWTLERANETGHRPSARETLLDFNIGYIGTAILAVCFMLLGAAVMHGSGEPIEKGAGAFAAQVIKLYAPLGDWAKPIIGTAALAVMFSTTLTVVDGFPRAIARLRERFSSDEVADATLTAREQRSYWVALAAVGAGGLVIIGFFKSSLVPLVVLATVLSFLTAPVLAWLNHRVITSADVPESFRPSAPMIAFSIAGIAFNALVALTYLGFMALK